MKPTAWAHLPNAAAIDRVLARTRESAQVKNAAYHPAEDVAEDVAWDADRTAVLDAASNAVWTAARTAARTAVLDAASNAVWTAARTAAWDAISALIADDTCAWMLDAPPQTLQTLVRLEPTNYAAVLMLAYSFYNAKD